MTIRLTFWLWVLLRFIFLPINLIKKRAICISTWLNALYKSVRNTTHDSCKKDVQIKYLSLIKLTNIGDKAIGNTIQWKIKCIRNCDSTVKNVKNRDRNKTVHTIKLCCGCYLPSRNRTDLVLAVIIIYVYSIYINYRFLISFIKRTLIDKKFNQHKSYLIITLPL